MPEIHTWKTSVSGLVYDPTLYADGVAFADGDTIAFSSGAFRLKGTLGDGFYQVTATGAVLGFEFQDASTGSGAIVAAAGPTTLEWLDV